MMNVSQKELYIAIGRILWEDWDPIGVNEFPEASDEYYGYTPIIFQLKNQQADMEVVANELYRIETERMGLTGNIEHCRTVAKKIVELQ